MRVAIEHSPSEYRVYVYLLDRGKYALISTDFRTNRWLDYDQGAKPQPYLTLDKDVWDAIIKEACGLRTEGDDGLRDAREVRDRLLTMIESEWSSRQLESK